MGVGFLRFLLFGLCQRQDHSLLSACHRHFVDISRLVGMSDPLPLLSGGLCKEAWNLQPCATPKDNW